MFKLFNRLGYGAFIAFLQFFYLYQVFATNDMGGISFSALSIFLVVLSLFSVRILFQLLISIFAYSKKSASFISVFFLLCFGLLVGYQFKAHELPDWSLVRDNIANAFNPEALDVIFQNLDTGALWYIFIFSIVTCWVEFKRGSVSRLHFQTHRWKKTAVLGVVYAALVLLPYESLDPFVQFFRSVLSSYFPKVQLHAQLKSGEYPLYTHRSFQSYPNLGNRRPDVFLVICESMNYSAIDRKTPDGREWTPFLNQLKNQSVYVDPFYGNSIQTAKGHFATLFGTTPSMTGKAYTTFEDVKLDSIASVLKASGYETIYFGAHNRRDFDNNRRFLMSHGFDKFEVAKDYLTPDEAQTGVCKWGPYDDVFFQSFLRFYNQEKEKTDAPLFIVVTTIATHFPFNHLDQSRQKLFPEPKHFSERYANSIHHTDEGLRLFFNSLPTINPAPLVMVLGDHAYPMGEHGNYHLEAGYNEESFRVPFFMVWPGVLSPQFIRETHSQLDVAPTILDLLDIDPDKSHFQGVSIFNTEARAYIPLVQCYGKQFSLIQRPFKYRYSQKLNKEYVYNLETDPREENNIVKTISNAQLESFRTEFKKMILTQETLEQNQVRP